MAPGGARGCCGVWKPHQSRFPGAEPSSLPVAASEGARVGARAAEQVRTRLLRGSGQTPNCCVPWKRAASVGDRRNVCTNTGSVGKPPKEPTALREGPLGCRMHPRENHLGGKREACTALGTARKARAGGQAFSTARRIGAPPTYFDVALNAAALLDGGPLQEISIFIYMMFGTIISATGGLKKWVRQTSVGCEVA